MDMFKFVHYEAQTVRKRTVDILLKCLLVYNLLVMYLIVTKLMNVICWTSILGTVKIIDFTVCEI